MSTPCKRSYETKRRGLKPWLLPHPTSPLPSHLLKKNVYILFNFGMEYVRGQIQNPRGGSAHRCRLLPPPSSTTAVSPCHQPLATVRSSRHGLPPTTVSHRRAVLSADLWAIRDGIRLQWEKKDWSSMWSLEADRFSWGCAATSTR